MNSESERVQAKIHKIVLFGGSAASLFLLRSFSRSGWHVIMVTTSKEFASRSKYGELHLISEENSLGRIVEGILSRHGSGLKAVATDEFFLNQVLRYVPALWEQFDWLMSDRETSTRLLRKKSAYEICRACGIPVPQVYELTELLASERFDVYPLVGKRDAYQKKTQEAGLPKCFVIRSREELASYVEKYAGAAEDILLQEMVDEPFRPVSVGGFYVDGEERCSIVVEQVRQHPLGVTCFAREAQESQWTELVRGHMRRFTKNTRYTGFLEMEFRTNGEQVWLLDINPRLWKWMSILAVKYPGFPHRLFADDAMGESGERGIWADPYKDLIAMLKDRSLRGLKEYRPGMGMYMVDFRDWGPYTFLWRK